MGVLEIILVVLLILVLCGGGYAGQNRADFGPWPSNILTVIVVVILIVLLLRVI